MRKEPLCATNTIMKYVLTNFYLIPFHKIDHTEPTDFTMLRKHDRMTEQNSSMELVR